MIFADAHAIAAAIRSGAVSAREVVEAHLVHIHRHNPTLNAIVTLDEAGALAAARAADEAQARGEPLGPLHGVPVTVKDAIETAGLRTTCGTPDLADYVPAADAVAVARLRQAGAVVLGKTNVPVLSAAVQVTNPLFGRTNNPWDVARTPGGSSGGLRLAWTPDLGGLPVDSAVQGLLAALAEKLAGAGCRVAQRFPEAIAIDHAVTVWVALAQAERNWTMRPPEEPLPDVRHYAETLMQRDALARCLEAFFDTCDALLCPATGIAAFPHLEHPEAFVIEGEEVPYYKPLTPFNMLFSVSGHPVIVLPLGLTPSGLPVGVQLVGPRWGEARLLSIARALADVFGSMPRPSGYAV